MEVADTIFFTDVDGVLGWSFCVLHKFGRWFAYFSTLRQPFAIMQACIRRTLSFVVMPSVPE